MLRDEQDQSEIGQGVSDWAGIRTWRRTCPSQDAASPRQRMSRDTNLAQGLSFPGRHLTATKRKNTDGDQEREVAEGRQEKEAGK